MSKKREKHIRGKAPRVARRKRIKGEAAPPFAPGMDSTHVAFDLERTRALDGRRGAYTR